MNINKLTKIMELLEKKVTYPVISFPAAMQREQYKSYLSTLAIWDDYCFGFDDIAEYVIY